MKHEKNIDKDENTKVYISATQQNSYSDLKKAIEYYRTVGHKVVGNGTKEDPYRWESEEDKCRITPESATQLIKRFWDARRR